MTYVSNNENTVNHLSVWCSPWNVLWKRLYWNRMIWSMAIPFSTLSCNPLYLDWHVFLLLCSSGSKQLVRVCSSSLSFAAPTQRKLKSFCAAEQSDLAASGRFHTDDLDLLPAAERNLSKLILCNAQVSKHLSSEMEKLSEGRKELSPAGP